MVDTLGLVLAVCVSPVSVNDRDGVEVLLARCAGKFPRLRYLWADQGYRGRGFQNGIRNGIRRHLCGLFIDSGHRNSIPPPGQRSSATASLDGTATPGPNHPEIGAGFTTTTVSTGAGSPITQADAQPEYGVGVKKQRYRSPFLPIDPYIHFSHSEVDPIPPRDLLTRDLGTPACLLGRSSVLGNISTLAAKRQFEARAPCGPGDCSAQAQSAPWGVTSTGDTATLLRWLAELDAVRATNREPTRALNFPEFTRVTGSH